MEKRATNKRDKPSQNDNVKILTFFVPAPTATFLVSFRISMPLVLWSGALLDMPSG
jgi:hypothetical protein